MRSLLSRKLGDSQGVFFALYATLSAFLLYSCMYAFRKPFTAAEFAYLPQIAGMSYKEALVLAQIIGYACSKFLGIRIVAELNKARRAFALIGLMSIAWLALLAFALLPPFKTIFAF